MKKNNLLESTSQVRDFQEQLLNWYQQNHRQLPWRETLDPYRIWVSEVMLQQTQVKKVLPYYEKFIRRFPDITTLAQADLSDVLKEWELLGYYARARHLHKAAQIIKTTYNGQVPSNYKEFRKIPGVGDYIAAAVLSIAYKQNLPVLDGNVKRVLARIFQIEKPVNHASSLKYFYQQAEQLLYRKSPDHYNQALMELGATVCIPQNPRCYLCPVSKFCSAFQNGKQYDYPKKKRKKKIPQYKIVVGVIQKDGKILITQRKLKGLLAGLWEFPGGKMKQGEKAEKACLREIEEELGLRVKINQHLTQIKHAYTHFKIVMDVFLCQYISGSIHLKSAIAYHWIKISEIDTYPFPGANHKFIPKLKSVLSEKLN